jgi:hypothetical protein
VIVPMMVMVPVMVAVPVMMNLPIIANGRKNEHEGSLEAPFTNSCNPVFDLPGGTMPFAHAISRLGAARKDKSQGSGEGESFHAALHNHPNLRFMHSTLRRQTTASRSIQRSFKAELRRSTRPYAAFNAQA